MIELQKVLGESRFNEDAVDEKAKLVYLFYGEQYDASMSRTVFEGEMARVVERGFLSCQEYEV
jgi:hypothetical protein